MPKKPDISTNPIDVAGYALLVVAVLIVWSPLYQHPDLQTNLANGTLPLSLRVQANSPAWLRYARDAVALAGVSIGFAVRQPNRATFLALLAWEASLVVCGLVGHFLLPRPALLIAGLRWIVTVHLFSTYMLILPQCSDRCWQRIIVAFNWSIGLLGLVLSAGFLVQWNSVDYVTYFRLTSVFPEVGPIMAFSIGAVVYVTMTYQPKAVRWTALSFGVACAFFTATRGIVFPLVNLASVGILAAGIGAWSKRFPRLGRPVWALASIPLVSILALSIPIATFVGHRGDLLEQQSDNRLGIFLHAPDVLEKESTSVLIFGKGLGYQTTAANTLGLRDFYNDPWISGPDDGLYSIYSQLGFAGATIFFGAGVFLFSRLYYSARDDVRRQVGATTLFVIYSLLMFTTWFYEWHALMVCAAIAISYVLGRKPINGPSGFPFGWRCDSSSETGACRWAATI